MDISIDRLIEVLRTAQERDLDDDLPVDVKEEHMALTIFLSQHAWQKLAELLGKVE